MNSYFKAILEATDDGKSMEQEKYWRMYHGQRRLVDTDLLQRLDKTDIFNTKKTPNYRSHQFGKNGK